MPKIGTPAWRKFINKDGETIWLLNEIAGDTPCPHCGGIILDFLVETVPSRLGWIWQKHLFAVKCKRCGSHGPYAKKMPEASRLWDIRSPIPKTIYIPGRRIGDAPCPHCGSTELEERDGDRRSATRIELKGDTVYSLQCKKCGWKGPWMLSRDKAGMAWGDRVLELKE